MENFFFRGICLLTSWACTIGIWSTLVQLNLITQIYWLCYKPFWCLLCYLSIVTLCWSFLTLYRLYLSLMFLLSKWFLQVTCWGTFVRIFYISRWGYSCNMIQKLTNWMYDIYGVLLKVYYLNCRSTCVCVVYSTVPLKSRLTALTQNLLLESNAQNYQESRLKFQVSRIKMLKELFEDLDCSFKETT